MVQGACARGSQSIEASGGGSSSGNPITPVQIRLNRLPTVNVSTVVGISEIYFIKPNGDAVLAYQATEFSGLLAWNEEFNPLPLAAAPAGSYIGLHIVNHATTIVNQHGENFTTEDPYTIRFDGVFEVPNAQEARMGPLEISNSSFFTRASRMRDVNAFGYVYSAIGKIQAHPLEGKDGVTEAVNVVEIVPLQPLTPPGGP
ncbi:MAG: hypothetical protein AB7P04_10505 [Bacteriovoracia bacterium]